MNRLQKLIYLILLQAIMLGGVLYKNNQLSSTSTHRPLYEKTVGSLWAPDEAYGQGGSCGNGQVDGGEQCDDGNGVGGDGCSSSCRFAGTINAGGVCGDGVIQGGRGEQCDDGNGDNGDSCTSLCFPGAGGGGFCGDGTIQTPNGEQCDDGNTTNGDGCRLCQRERPECILLSLPTPTYKGVVTSFNILLSPWINNSTNRVGFQPLLFGDGGSMPIGGPGIYNHLFVVAGSFFAQGQVTNTLGGGFGTVVCTNPVSVGGCGDGVVQGSFGEQCESGAGCDLTTCQRTPPQCGLISSSRSPGGPYATGMTLSGSFSTSQPGVSFLGGSTRIISPTVLGANTVNLFLTNPGGVIKLCPVTLTIAGCGDGVVQAGEQCDGQTGCNNQTCQWTLPSCDSLVVNRSQSPPYIAGTSLIASLSTNQPDISIVGATSITINPLLVGVNTINATIKNSANIYKLCTVSITAQGCGDGVVQAGEQCDDGNALGSDGCGASCQYEKPTCILDTTPNGGTAPLITAATRTLPSRATATLIDRGGLGTINNPSPGVTTTIFTPGVYTVSLLVKSTLSGSTATGACSTTITVSSSPLAGQCGSLHGQSYYSLQGGGVGITSSSNGICTLGSPIGLTYDTIDHTRSWYCKGINGGAIAVCTASEYSCGDGMAGTGINYTNNEQCDDGNTYYNDGCNGICLIEQPHCSLFATSPFGSAPLTTTLNRLTLPSWMSIQILDPGNGSTPITNPTIGGSWTYSTPYTYTATLIVKNNLPGASLTNQCSTSIQVVGSPIAGQCNALINGQTYTPPVQSLPTISSLCSQGTPVGVIQGSNGRTWGCDGVDGGAGVGGCSLSIQGCGDGIMQAGEQCDGQVGCDNLICQWSKIDCSQVNIALTTPTSNSLPMSTTLSFTTPPLFQAVLLTWGDTSSVTSPSNTINHTYSVSGALLGTLELTNIGNNSTFVICPFHIYPGMGSGSGGTGGSGGGGGTIQQQGTMYIPVPLPNPSDYPGSSTNNSTNNQQAQTTTTEILITQVELGMKKLRRMLDIPTQIGLLPEYIYDTKERLYRLIAQTISAYPHLYNQKTLIDTLLTTTTSQTTTTNNQNEKSTSDTTKSTSDLVANNTTHKAPATLIDLHTYDNHDTSPQKTTDPISFTLIADHGRLTEQDLSNKQEQEQKQEQGGVNNTTINNSINEERSVLGISSYRIDIKGLKNLFECQGSLYTSRTLDICLQELPHGDCSIIQSTNSRISINKDKIDTCVREINDYKEEFEVVQGGLYIEQYDRTTSSIIDFVKQFIPSLTVRTDIFDPYLPGFARIEFDPAQISNKHLFGLLRHLGLSNKEYLSINPSPIPLFHIATVGQINNTLAPDDIGLLKSFFNDPLLSKQSYLQSIHYPQAHAICNRNSKQSIKVAIVDSAFETSHEDFDRNSIKATQDIANKDNDVNPPFGHDEDTERSHGTYSAGIIGAHSNNEKGIISIAGSTTSLFLYKAAADNGRGSDIGYGAEAIVTAAKGKPEIISLSRGAYIDNTKSLAFLEKIINKITDQGTIIIASAGNYNKSQPFYPAAFDRVVSVGAVDNNHNKASFSNYGPRVDLAAPGVDIITTSLGNLYQLIDGTSESAPLFAGALAWIMSKGGSLETLQQTLTPVEGQLGQGVLNLEKACSTLATTYKPGFTNQHYAPNDPQDTVTNQAFGTQGPSRITPKTLISLLIIILLIMIGYMVHKLRKG